MATPLIGLSNRCFGTVPGIAPEGQKWNTGNYIAVGTMTFDAVVSLTALVLGILGVLSVIIMPVAAAYSLIAISGTITLLWIINILKRTIDQCQKPEPNY
jgi:hypothetical protein